MGAAAYRYYDPHMQSSPMETVAPTVYNRPPYPPPSFVACGEDFTIAAHRDSPDWYSQDQETNVLMCSGENGEGQCGRSLQQQQNDWKPVRLPKRSRTLAVECGQSHCMTLLATGSLFAWGANHQGQIGNGKRGLVAKPALVAKGAGTRDQNLDPDGSASVKPTTVYKGKDGEWRAPAAEVFEPPGKIITISCGFRNSAFICEAAVT